MGERFAAGLVGLDHGDFKILQGSTRPASPMFPSMGPPCDPEIAWNTCESAMSYSHFLNSRLQKQKELLHPEPFIYP